MKVVAIVNQKGGTGKTTTTLNLGSALAKKKKRILLLDMDAQGNLGYSLGVTDFEQSLADVFLGDIQLSEVIARRENMDIAPSGIGLADVELSLSDAENRSDYLKDILSEVSGYDYVLIDCPPSLSLLTVNALNAADQVVVPMQMEVLSLQGLDLITETVRKVKQSLNPDLEILGILPVMVDKRRKLSAEVHEHISQNYEVRIFQSVIRNNVKASEAPSFGSSVIEYAPTSNSARDYMTFANEFLKLNK